MASFPQYTMELWPAHTNHSFPLKKLWLSDHTVILTCVVSLQDRFVHLPVEVWVGRGQPHQPEHMMVKEEESNACADDKEQGRFDAPHSCHCNAKISKRVKEIHNQHYAIG